MLARASVTEGFWALARAQAAAKPGSKAAKAGEAVAQALAEGDLKRRMDALLQALFTKEGQGEARKQLGDAPELGTVPLVKVPGQMYAGGPPVEPWYFSRASILSASGL